MISMTPRLKVMTILGTRPEIIRLSRVMALLDQHVEHVLVHTGQNSDFELSDIFFRDLGVRAPKHCLGIDRSSLGTILAGVILESERILKEERPDAVLILGDTNSAYAAVIARRMKIPVYHMEAGNRCFDLNVPEEINRRVVDHVSDFNLVYTEHARRNLLAEGIHPRKIYLTGSPMREVLKAAEPGIHSADILRRLDLAPKKYLLVSTHRAENVDVPDHLRSLLQGIERVCDEFDLPAVVSTHPRTKQRLEALGGDRVDDRIRFLKPFGYHDYVRLQLDAFCTLSDSGTISEESAILGFPAVTLRTAIERPEALDAGRILMTGRDPEAILQAVRFVTSEGEPRCGAERSMPAEYAVGDASRRVVQLILSTAKLAHAWDGIVAT